MEDKLEKELRGMINKKLVEYDSFFDEEMSKYIMVLIANKKTKEQVEKDLELFLGKNSHSFSNWLYDLLGEEYKGSQPTANNTNAVVEQEQPKKAEKTVAAYHSSDDEDVLAIDAIADDFLNVDFQDDVSKKNKVPEPISPVGSNLFTMSNVRQENARTTAKHHFLPHSPTSLGRAIKHDQKPAYQPTAKRFKPESNDEEEEEEYDPFNPSLKSVVRRRAPDVQANRLLLLKAVDEANKSIVGKEHIDEIYKPTPIKVLVSAARKKSHYREMPPEGKLLHSETSLDEKPILQPRASTPIHNSIMHQNSDWNHAIPRRNLLQIPTEPMPLIEDANSKHVRYSKFNMDSSSVVQSDTEFMDEESHMKDDSFMMMNKQTHFVVTLNGYNSNLKRKRAFSPDDSSETSDNFESARFKSHLLEDDSQEDFIMDDSDLKLTEKCRYWPSCRNGSSCIFFHPTSMCNTFPNCKFGDRCYYIHPNCKFDTLCSKRDCPYTHMNKREATLPFSRPGKLLPLYRKAPVCRFHPNCIAFNCFFFHPRKCRFGLQCFAPNCPFSHPTFPPRQKLKWEAISAFSG